MHKRAWLEIIASILSSLEESRLKKTHLINMARIDNRAASKYVSFLLARGFIAKSEDEIGFEITGKGRVFLKSYRNMLEMLQTDSLGESPVLTPSRP